MIIYPAKIKYNKSDKAYLVEFLDLTISTYGETLEDAKKNAKEALTGYLESIDLRSLPIPKPSKGKGKDIYFIEPSTPVSFAISLKLKRQEQGFTQKAIAEKLNIKFQTYQKFENPVKANPTLKTIVKLQEIFKEKFV